MMVGPEARKLIEAQPIGTIDDHAVRIAEGSGHDDEDDGVTAPMHPAAVVVIAILLLLALAISGGLLAALVMRAI